MVSDPTMTERPLSETDINLVYTSELQSKFASITAERSDKVCYVFPRGFPIIWQPFTVKIY